jgi:HEAT repeat protein
MGAVHVGAMRFNAMHFDRKGMMHSRITKPVARRARPSRTTVCLLGGACLSVALGTNAPAQSTPVPPIPPPAVATAASAMAIARAELASVHARLAAAGPVLAAVGPRLAAAPPALAAARTSPPAPWLQEDPGARAYQAAREALNRRRYQEAARQFASLRAEHPTSGYVADSYYWQAFALSREGGQSSLRQASELLRLQAREHADAGTRADADALLVRIEAQLAQRGDAQSAALIAQQAAGPCDEDQEVRLAALSALLNMNAEQAVPILQEVLQSRDECSVELRRRAVFLISQKMTDESVDILLDLAHRNPDPDPEVREQAVFWLHQVRTPEALDALESILAESDDGELQERAIFAISQRGGDQRAVEILRSYAERSDVPRDLRENAIFWIGQNPDADGAAYLMELYSRLDDGDLKERAIFGIAQSRGEEARAWLLARARDPSEPMELRKNALFWAGQSGGLAATELQDLYATLEDMEMKEQVIFVASQRREATAVDFLMEVVRTEQDRELRERAIFWLGQSNDPRVGEFLLSLIRG